MFNPSVGMIFKCSNGKFVKIQGSGLVEQPDTKYIEGYLGHEIDGKGKDVGGWLYWDFKGNNPRSGDWNLVESCGGTDPKVAKEKGWPIDQQLG